MEMLKPRAEAFEGRRKEYEAAEAARRAALPRNEIFIPQDPNAVYAASLAMAPAPTMPTEAQLQATWTEKVAAPLEDIYDRQDPAGMLYESCLHMRDEHVEMLTKRRAPTNFIDPLTNYTPLHIAAFNGRERAVACLLDANADPTLKDTVRHPGACCSLRCDTSR